MTVMGDAFMEGLSDAGSIPARSILKTLYLRRFFGLKGLLFFLVIIVVSTDTVFNFLHIIFIEIILFDMLHRMFQCT